MPIRIALRSELLRSATCSLGRGDGRLEVDDTVYRMYDRRRRFSRERKTGGVLFLGDEVDEVGEKSWSSSTWEESERSA